VINHLDPVPSDGNAALGFIRNLIKSSGRHVNITRGTARASIQDGDGDGAFRTLNGDLASTVGVGVGVGTVLHLSDVHGSHDVAVGRLGTTAIGTSRGVVVGSITGETTLLNGGGGSEDGSSDGKEGENLDRDHV
jgi:hypothetical protein